MSSLLVLVFRRKKLKNCNTKSKDSLWTLYSMPAQLRWCRHFYLSVFIRVIRVRQLGRPWVVDMVATLKILEKSITKSKKKYFDLSLAEITLTPLFKRRWWFLFLDCVTIGVFASEDVLRCIAMCGDIMACAGARSQAQSREISTEVRRAKTSKEGFF